MADPTFSPDIKFEPYWWEESPRPRLPEVDLPASVDVAVVGSGYTGLSAALTLAREGRSVVVLDSEDAGFGCSSRNGGQIGSKLKRGLDDLARSYGRPRALAMVKEVLAAREYVEHLVRSERIECDFAVCGRFVGAHRPSDYESLAREVAMLRRDLGIEADAVSRAEQHRELGTDAYHGGQVIHNNAGLHPAKLHQGLLERALAAGARVVSHTPVTGIGRNGKDFTVASSRGPIQARDVIVATNGYTGTFQPELRRRVIPIGSYIIATEPLPPGLMDRLMPKRRVVSDTRNVVYYYRPSPDGRRILFGGRVAATETDPRVSAPRLHAVLSGLFPELKGVKVSHSWLGFVAYTFDHLPHIGVRDGLHYAMGYCGSGVHLAPYLGHKAALKVLGKAEGKTAFDELPFETRPLYSGTPWFLGGTVMYYRLIDRLPSGIARHA